MKLNSSWAAADPLETNQNTVEIMYDPEVGFQPRVK